MKRPTRPALPVLLIPLAFAWVGIVIASKCAYLGPEIAPILPLSGACILLLVGGMWLAKKRRLPLPLLSLLFFSLALGCGSMFYGERAEESRQALYYDGTQELVVVEDTKQYASSQGTEVLLISAQGAEIRMRAFWNELDIELPKGSHITAFCTFTPLREDQRWLFDQGVVGTLSLSDIATEGFSEDLWGLIDTFRQDNVEKMCAQEGEGAALAAGVLLGYRGALQATAVEQDFITCGLTHLIAVSGSHLAVVAALLGWLLGRLPLGRIPEIAILLAVLALYVMLTGLQPSAIRSALMAGVAGVSAFVGRRGHAPSALAAAALLMLLVYPANAYSLGFWLSVFAVMGITLFTNLVASWLSIASPFRSSQTPGALASALALTLTATAATLPLATPTFAVLSLVGPLANLVAAPLISLVLGIGMLALIITPVLGPLGELLFHLTIGISDLVTSLSTLLAQIPGASVPFTLSLEMALVLGLSLAALLYSVWPLPGAKLLRSLALGALALVCIAAYVLPYFVAPRLIAMDVGQGDALLVQEQGHCVLIDTGASDTALVQALARNGVKSLDAVIITHLDDDHAGALKRLRGLVPVEEIYVARGLVEHQADNAFLADARDVIGERVLKELTQGDCLPLGRTLTLVVLWPEEQATEGSNDESICLLLRYDENADGIAEQQALLTGDAESPELQRIMQDNTGLTASVVKIGHHGSREAITPEILAHLKTTVALISVGTNNRYGHPAAETLEALSVCDVDTYRTDERGDITCSFKNSTLELSCATMIPEVR